jgi:predicted aspartyl protease
LSADLNLIIVPDPDDPDAAEILVDGFVGGRPYRFLLDTGAAQTALAADDYTSALGVIDEVASSGVFKPATHEVILVPSIEVGPIRAENVVVVRSPDGALRRSLIGMDVLKGYCLHFRFDTGQVSALDAAPASVHYQDLVMGRRSHPYVKVECGSRTAMSVWDTGASMTVVDEAFIRRVPEFFDEAGTSMGTDSTGAELETKTYVMTGATIGGHEFPPHRVAAVDLSHVNSTIEIPMDMVLGYSTLRPANWLFDFPGRRWALVTQ